MALGKYEHFIELVKVCLFCGLAQNGKKIIERHRELEKDRCVRYNALFVHIASRGNVVDRCAPYPVHHRYHPHPHQQTIIH